MKFAFFGYDYTLDIAQRLVKDGHELIKIFTFPCDNMFIFNAQTHEFAQHYTIPITEQSIQPNELHDLIQQGCTLFLATGYPHKIPPIEQSKIYGINVHPALLPRGRGIMPIPYIIMESPEIAGFTIHKLTNQFDGGDILYQHAVEMDEMTDIETLSAKLALLMPKAVSMVVKDIDTYWRKAKPQNPEHVTKFSLPSDEMRHLDWGDTVEALLKKGRAFGRFGVTATITNVFNQSQTLAVFQFSGWKETHTHPTGLLLRSSPREIIITAQDGFICLKEFQPLT